MRFEAKHNFFKQVARHTNCFKNIPLTLAAKHQQVIAYHINASHLTSTVEVTNVSTLPVDVLNKEVVTSLRQKYFKINKGTSSQQCNRQRNVLQNWHANSLWFNWWSA